MAGLIQLSSPERRATLDFDRSNRTSIPVWSTALGQGKPSGTPAQGLCFYPAYPGHHIIFSPLEHAELCPESANCPSQAGFTGVYQCLIKISSGWGEGRAPPSDGQPTSVGGDCLSGGGERGWGTKIVRVEESLPNPANSHPTPGPYQPPQGPCPPLCHPNLLQSGVQPWQRSVNPAPNL